MAPFIMYTLMVFVWFGLSGCAPIVAAGAGTTAYVANQETPVTQQARDLHIKANIKDQLIRTKISYFKDLEVNVEDGEVLLMGVLKSPAEKNMVQNIAVKQKYVRKIHNKIIVDHNYKAMSYLNDSIIANLIRTRMIFSRGTYLSKLNIEVFKNRVYIFGTVSNEKEKAVAEYIARTGKGVQSVTSFIKVAR